MSIQKNALLPLSLSLPLFRRRGFRRRAYAAFSQTLLNLRPIVMHNEKEDGSRSLGRSSDTVYYDGSVPTQRSGEEKEREGGTRKESGLLYIHVEGQSTLARPESAIVRYEWLSRWTFPYPSRYILSAHCGLPDISMLVLETPIEYHRFVFDFSMSVAGLRIRTVEIV